MLFFWKESACQWQWERSLGIFSYKLIRSSLGLLHRFLGSLRKFIRFLTSAPQTIEYRDVIRWIHKKNSDTWSEGRKVFQCLWWNQNILFLLVYFLFSFHSYSPLPIGVRVIFWNSPSKLGSVQWTCGWRALESTGSESFEKICEEFEWRTSARYSWRRRKSHVGKRAEWQWISGNV